MADGDTMRVRMCAARQRAYCAAAVNPRVQSVVLTLGDPPYTIDTTAPITERQQATTRDSRTTIATTRREASAVLSKAAVAEIVEIEGGYYGMLTDEAGTEWRIVSIPYQDDAVFRVRLVCSGLSGAGKARPIVGR